MERRRPRWRLRRPRGGGRGLGAGDPLRALLVGLLLPAVCLADGAPKPPAGRTPEVIDYAAPERYARIPAADGDEATIRRLAGPLCDDDPEQTIRNVYGFVAGRVPHLPSRGWDPDFRRFEPLLEGFDHTGCAEYALLFANLLRAAGVPAVYVKSAKHDWIRTFVATGATGAFDGHVFLEVHYGGRWRLLEDQGLRVWDDYDPADPELPGGYLAYEKGSDAFAMVHSTRRDRFRDEAVARWSGFDPSRLRRSDAPGRRLLPGAHAITLASEWKVLGERLAGLRSFDGPHWATSKGACRGQVLFVTSFGGTVGIPASEVPDWLPVTLDQLREDRAAGRSLVRTRTLDDGTRVVLLSAPGWSELMALIWTTDLCGHLVAAARRPR